MIEIERKSVGALPRQITYISRARLTYLFAGRHRAAEHVGFVLTGQRDIVTCGVHPNLANAFGDAFFGLSAVAGFPNDRKL